jgi:hypothetical protein
MDEAIESFIAFTGSSADVARRYLGLTENNPEQAIQLFFDSPDLGGDSAAQTTAPPVPTSTRPSRRPPGREGEESRHPVELSDDDMDVDHDDEDDEALRAAAVGRAADYEDDEAIARRMQEELYAGGDGGFDADGIRAPIGRTTETLVGGHDGHYQPDDLQDDAMRLFRARAGRGGSSCKYLGTPLYYLPTDRTSARPGVFNQRPVPSIWDETADATTRRQGMAEATGGASEASSKAARLAELFRPPFELMRQVSWDVARDSGKEEKKWIIVNVQDPALFDCQKLNRDIWKHEGIKELVKENFIFIQYSKDDPRGNQYFQYYFQFRDNQDSYPHIAIIDPRTGEQVKVWSGPPVPNPSDFLMQLVEFLDRYSLDASKKNPVAKRKLEKPKSLDVNRLTEEEMLDLALQNSLANNGSGSGPKEADPDELTKSFGDVSKGKGKEVENEATEVELSADQAAVSSGSSPFAQIMSNAHTEPNPGPGVTRIQFRHSNGRVVRRFSENDPVRRIYEWLKAEPLEGRTEVAFDLKGMGKDLIEYLDDTIADAGLKNGTVMVEFIED